MYALASLGVLADGLCDVRVGTPRLTPEKREGL